MESHHEIHRIVVVSVLAWMFSFIHAQDCPELHLSVNGPMQLCCHASDTIRVTVEDTVTCTFQWQDSIPGGTWDSIHAGGNMDYYQITSIVNGIYYYRCIVSPVYYNECPSDTSEVIIVQVYDSIKNGTIGGGDSICRNTTPPLLSQVSKPSGGDGIFGYQWQDSIAGGSWHDVTGENGTDTIYQPDNLHQTTYFRLLAFSSCQDTIPSNEIEIYVHDALNAPSIPAFLDTVCYGYTPDTIFLTEGIHDVHDSVLYQWFKKSVNAENEDTIQGATNLYYQPDPITEACMFRVMATSLHGCDTAYSDWCIINVYDSLLIQTNEPTPLCYKGSGTISVSASGAGDAYSYQWQELAGGEWQNATGVSNDSEYTVSSKEGNTYQYHCIVTPLNGCPSDTSAVIPVVVYDALTPGVIEGTDTICTNGTPRPMIQTERPRGGDGVYTYQWKQNDGNGWVNAPGNSTDTVYTPGQLQKTTTYCLVATTACDSIESNYIKVYVREPLVAPVIPSSLETVCHGFPPSLITIQKEAKCDPTDSVLYQWYSREVGGMFEPISGETGKTFQPKAIVTAHQYCVVATSLMGCELDTSNVCTVEVYDDLVITTEGTEPLCYMDNGSIKVIATGEGGDYDYQWQDSINGQWTNVPNEGNKARYNIDQKKGGDYYYRCIVIPTLGCNSDTSSVITVHVYDDFSPGRIGLVGADTICYGLEADTIKFVVPASGGKGGYQYKWWRKPSSASNFTPISTEKKEFIVPGTLFETTEYTLEVTDNCGGALFTDTVRIYVRDELHKPVLANYPDTICYNTIPDPIVIDKLATGGVDDSFTYQWYYKSKDENEFSQIQGEHDTVYQPKEPLVQTRYYQVRAISAKCGNVLISDSIVVNVYDSLHIETVNPDTLCYMGSTTIYVDVTGGGKNYSYQWQDSIPGGTWQNVPTGGQDREYITKPQTNGDYYYKCIVYANKCENYYRISPTITVSVYEALNPGTITGVDSTCYGYAPDYPLSVAIPATGVDGHYTYQWQVLKDGHWEDTSDKDTTETFQPDPLFEDAAYHLQVSSKCETYATDSILIRVNPLPEKQEIKGANDVCYHHYERYSVETLNPGYNYEWMLKNDHGVLPDVTVNTSVIDILWEDPLSTDSVILVVTNNVTGCVDTMKYGVSICNEKAPDTTIIVKKPNDDILVCQAGQGEDDKYTYKWGCTNLETREDSTLREYSNHRYVFVEDFDEMRYTYWVELRHNIPNPRCFSRSHYNPDNDSLIYTSSNEVSVPSYVHGRIPITIQNAYQEEVSCSIYAISGELVAVHELGRELYIEQILPFPVNTGIYLMRVKIGDKVESIKLIAE